MTMVDRFRELHASGCFVMPNPWDPGSARLCEAAGFPAVATTSAGFAWTQARPDNGVSVAEVLAHLEAMRRAVRVPVNADFEGGFADGPEGVDAHVTRALDTGIAGISIEDSTRRADAPLYSFDDAVARVRAAIAAVRRAGSGVVVTARSEGFLVGRPDFAETVRRLTAFAEVGAGCVYAPGLRDLALIERLVSAVAPVPVNVLMSGSAATRDALAAVGVRRVSVGGALARVAWTAATNAMRRIAETGHFDVLDGTIASTVLNERFSLRHGTAWRSRHFARCTTAALCTSHPAHEKIALWPPRRLFGTPRVWTRRCPGS
jgi:methylisocitrate lyase